MKLKIKYSSTKKFAIVTEDKFGDLIEAIKNFLLETYNINHRDQLILSLNGKDALHSDSESTLTSLGIVQGDIITVLHTSCNAKATCAQKNLEKPYSSCIQKNTSQSAESKLEATFKKIGESRKITPEKNVLSLDTFFTDDAYFLEIIENVNKCCPASLEVVVNLLIHYIILKNGFELNLLQADWSKGVVTVEYKHTNFEDFNFTLVLITIGNTKKVLASFTNQDTELSFDIAFLNYISTFPLESFHVKDVLRFNRMLKDSLLFPLHIAAHQSLGIPAPWHITGLPFEILLYITKLLDVKSVLHFGLCCHRTHAAVNDKKVWKSLYKRDFTNLFKSTSFGSNIDWKKKYSESYVQLKEYEKMQKNFTYVTPWPEINIPPPQPYPSPYFPFHDIPHPIGPLPPFYPNPNIIGDPDNPFFGEIPVIPRPGRHPNIRPGLPYNPKGPRIHFI